MASSESTPASRSEVGVARSLGPELLYRRTDLAALAFKTTAEIAPLEGAVSQHRAVASVKLGTEIKRPGFNMFVIGPREARMGDALEALLKGSLGKRKLPSDWVYVNNFADQNTPTAIELPAGRATDFQKAMHGLVEDLRVTIPSAFESDDYVTRRSALEDNLHKAQTDAFSALREKAASKGVVVLRTPLGFALAPASNGSVVPVEEFSTWPEAKRLEMQQDIAALEKDLEQAVRQVPQIVREHRNAVRQLDRETAEVAVGHLIEDIKTRFADLARVVTHLESVRLDLLENIAMFIAKHDDGSESPAPPLAQGAFERYEVNVLISHDRNATTAPFVEELHPTLNNLIGRIEYVAHQGTLVTNFRMIRAGALHKANGGYLLIDARSLLMEPFSWPALKRTLRRQTIVVEDVARFLGLTSTVSLEPEPIPLDIKIVLFGDRMLYFLLAQYDPELAEHFKIVADFEDDTDRTRDSEMANARVIASLVAREGLKPLSRDAVGAVIERCARLSGYAGKLSLLTEHVSDLVTEADQWATSEGRGIVEVADVCKAIEQHTYRNARLRDRMQESILRDMALISTSGATVGQINGLSVIELGGFAFGRPTRITARVRPGSGKVVDIEREVELGGPTHSKGVLILSGFLAGRYALDTPMSLFASLVFEQSYGGVEGDSASSAELYALISALAEVPLRQDLAVTGSVNQHGEVQPIGGVNEKIEGFFDICRQRGLTGTQGVVIPQSNVQNLMLHADVVEACASGKFAIYAVASIDEGIAILTGRVAGQRDERGRFADGSVNASVESRLRAFAQVRRSFSTTDGAAATGNAQS